MTISLIDEFYESINKGGAPGVEWALRHGVDKRTIFLPKPDGKFHGYPAFGADFIEVFKDGTYQPAAAGRVAFIMPVNRYGELGQDIDDLIAWEPKNPGRWWRRLGIAQVMNEQAINRARFDNSPLDLQPTPWAWMKSGFRGAVLLDPEMDVRALLSGLRVVVQSTGHGDNLRSLAQRHPLPAPRIMVRRAA